MQVIALTLLCVPGLHLATVAAQGNDDILDLLIPVFASMPRDGDGPNPPVPPPDDGDPNAPCAQTLSQDIFVNTTWRNTDAYCDILIVPRNDNNTSPGRAPVAIENATLTIEAGTRIRFGSRASIRIGDGATLNAIGTGSARIQFEADVAQRGYGRGILFSGGSLPSRIEFADFINLGREESLSSHDAAIVGSQSAGGLTLRDSTISGSSTRGIELDELPIVGFNRNVFFGNAEHGVLIAASQVDKLDAASDYLGTTRGAANGQPYVNVQGVGSFNQLESDATWEALNAPYFIDIALHLRGGALALAPGVQIVMSEGARVSVDERSSFRAVGTAAQPVVFRGAESRPGYWSNINYFESDSRDNRHPHLRISDGGGGRADAAVEADFRAYIAIANATISGNDGFAVCEGFGSEIDFEGGNDLTGNSQGTITVNC